MARKSKKQTLPEFQAFLAGIVEIQPAEWTPDAAQWKMIYEKILNIKEPVAEKVVAPAPAPVQQMPGYPQQPTYMPPPVPTQMPMINPADIEMSPAAKEMLATGKTPNSDADSPSAFE